MGKSKNMIHMMEVLLQQSTTHTITTYSIIHDDGEAGFFKVTETPEGVFINDPLKSKEAKEYPGKTEAFVLRRFQYR